jgi:hypothetical protein
LRWRHHVGIARVYIGGNKTGRKPLMQEAAAGGGQIHFTPA